MPSTDRMSLLDVVDPIFLLFCRLNRASRLKSANLSVAVIRAQIDRCFNEVEDRAVAAGQREQYDKLRLPLKCFIDMMLVHGALPFSQQWDYFTSRSECGAPGEYPFQELKKTMEDPAPEAAERLVVYHTMLSLGFQGVYFPDRGEELKAIYDELCQRVAIAANPPDELRLLPEEYRRIVRAPPRRVEVRQALTAMFIISGVLILLGAAVNIAVYRNYTRRLHDDLGSVEASLKNTAPGPSVALSKDSTP